MKIYKENKSHILNKFARGCLFIFAGATFAFAIYARNESDYLSYLIPIVLLIIGFSFIYKAFVTNTVLMVSDKGLVLSYLGHRYSKLIPWSDISSLEQIFFVTTRPAGRYSNPRFTFSYIMLKSTKQLNLPKARLTRLQYLIYVKTNAKNAMEAQKITSDVQALIPVTRIQATDGGLLHDFSARDKFGMSPTQYWDRMKFYGELTLKEILSYKQ